jgi:hypothetical protein
MLLWAEEEAEGFTELALRFLFPEGSVPWDYYIAHTLLLFPNRRSRSRSDKPSPVRVDERAAGRGSS